MNMNMIKRVLKLSLCAERARIMKYYNDALNGGDNRLDAIDSTIYGLVEGEDNKVSDALYWYGWYPLQDKGMSEENQWELSIIMEDYVEEVTK